MCPLAGPKAVYAVLLDTSDRLTPAQAGAVEQKIEGLQGAVPLHGALEIYQLAPTGERLLEPILAVCNPGDGKDANPLWSNPKRLAARWRERYDAPLQTVLARVLPAPDAATSPILEAIQSVAVTAFGAPERRNVEKRLLIVSDMIQNSITLSHYRGAGALKADRFLASAAARSAMPHLEGAAVDIVYLNRVTKEPIQGPDHVLFWERVIDAANGTLEHVWPR
jgi:hypothetical protein